MFQLFMQVHRLCVSYFTIVYVCKFPWRSFFAAFFCPAEATKEEPMSTLAYHALEVSDEEGTGTRREKRSIIAEAVWPEDNWHLSSPDQF